MPSASVTIVVEINSLTDRELDHFASLVKSSKESLASFLVAEGFSNLSALLNPPANSSFCRRGFSNPPPRAAKEA